jgi:hypothetical protein
MRLGSGFALSARLRNDAETFFGSLDSGLAVVDRAE